MPTSKDLLTGQLNDYICSSKCMGSDGNKGGCCTIGDRDYIIGPIADADAFIERLSRASGKPISRSDVMIEYAEGSALFPERPIWQKENSYPALRILLDEPRKPCRFYNFDAGQCTVYDIRPDTCRKYQCDYLRNALSML